MSTFKTKFSTKGPQRSLQRLDNLLTDLRPALEGAADELNAQIWYRFAFKRDPDGRPWKPWAASTAAAAKPGQKLMLNTRATRDRTRFIAARDGLRVRLGSPYARYHEQPTARDQSRRLVRRAFVFSIRNNRRALSESDERIVAAKLRYQVRKALKNK